MPAPFLGHSESLADHIRDMANAFASTAEVLSQHYTDLNNATNGLLDGADSWKGQGSAAFLAAWQSFGKYMQAMQKSCEDTYIALIKFANKLDDSETEEAWNILLTIAGGIITIVSFAAMIAELGLNPFVDGFTALIGTFTEQEGNDVVTISEEITQADSQAATELQQIEEQMTTSPALAGSDPSSPGSIPDAVSSSHLDDMTFGFDLRNLTGDQWGQFIEEDGLPYYPSGSMQGVNALDGNPLPNSCMPSSIKMLLADNGIDASDQEIMSDIGYNPATGTYPQNAAAGLRQLGLPTARFAQNMTVSDLENVASPTRPVIVGLKLGQAPGSGFDGHAVLVDGIGETDDGTKMVLIRDPYYNPPVAYRISLSQFEQVWTHSALTY